MLSHRWHHYRVELSLRNMAAAERIIWSLCISCDIAHIDKTRHTASESSPHLCFLHLLTDGVHVDLVCLLRLVDEVLDKEPRYRVLETKNEATAVDKFNTMMCSFQPSLIKRK